MRKFEDESVITGCGISAVGRRLGRGGLDLTVEAATAAIADAGLDAAKIDGLSTWPGPPGPGGAATGFTGPSTWDVRNALGLELNWHSSGGIEGPSQLGALFNACMAIAAGLCDHCLVYRTVTESSEQGQGRRAAMGSTGDAVGGWTQWSVPFGAYSGASRYGLVAQRHFHEFGTTREQLAMIAVVARENAAQNPTAVYTTPLTIQQYLDARMISTPLCLFDCDVPVDGSVAIVVSRADHHDATRAQPIRIEAVGSALRGSVTWDQWEGLDDVPAFHAARQMWGRTSLRPGDIDVAQLYDGFSFGAMTWIEALDFCPLGSSGPFVEGGARIRLDGELPLNTGGGQLSGGRLSGFGLLHEAIIQLRGDGGQRQVHGPVNTAVVSNGLGPIAGCVLLVRD